MAIDPEIAELFNALKKDKDIQVWKGDDLSMDSVAPFGVATGIPELDLYLGKRGGYPVGKIIEFYGFEKCGKTTAALQAASEWQKKNGIVYFIDTEKSFDPKRATQLGCSPENIICLEANTIEQVFSHIIDKIFEPMKAAGTTRPVLVIVDSVNGVPTARDAEGNIDKNDQVGFEARQIKRGCRKINPLLSDYDFNPTVLFINHAYAKIGGFGGGDDSDSGGGHGIKFYASVRIRFSHFSNVREAGDKDSRVGQKISVLISKLKGSALERDRLSLQLDNEAGFNKYLSLRDAMTATEYAYRAKGSQTLTVFYNTENAEDIKNADFKEWVEESGGYDTVYLNFRVWCIKRGFIEPWGGQNG
jgi:recombination protein RecA